MSADEILRTKLNQETARYPWKELLRHFAAGNVIAVAAQLDLLEVALCMANDDAAQIGAWLAAGQIAKVSDAQAQSWLEQDASLWSVVVKPWVIVQLRLS
ncbi:MAG: DUF2288 domain-containing protein [Burkholderiales bacterium]|nr:DUF2288 domain-containing protein [Burkholderiales bacterium]